ncbi:MAG TPA: aminodeoxychorismate synthase component I [Gammaproteobacteria bacterium]
MKVPQDTTVLLQDQQSGRSRWLSFCRPLEIIATVEPGEVMQCLEQIEARVESGLYAAGFISYEAAPGLDPALKTHAPAGVPCLWFGIFNRYDEVEPPDAGSGGYFSFDEWEPSISREEYSRSIEKIKHYIKEGDTYQVNYTFRLRSKFSGDSLRLFARLYQAQQSRYAAFIDLGRYKICSVSPEIFISLDGKTILSKPMKGTIKRGLTTEQDRQNADWLFLSEKNRAENVMIVDMIRNDIGRVADNGTVNVPKLFEIEKYPTVNQMTSTVTAETSAPIVRILETMFPCASITGAPKVKTMELIKELEPDPRGIYTGSIGYIAPGRKLQFNVAIRTVVLDMERQVAEYGVGGGITWGSETLSEYAECAAKAAVLTHARPEFELLESLLWDPDKGYFLFDEHLERLQDSSNYFDFQISIRTIREKLDALQRQLDNVRHKVRLLIARDGKITLEAKPLNSIVGTRVSLSKTPIKTDTPYVYHKTTNRAAYLKVMSSNATDNDLFLWNDDGCITETTIANIVIDDGDGRLVTPPVSCGLLAGVKRFLLLQHGIVSEQSISVGQLKNAEHVYLVNSVRGWMRLVRESDDTWRVLDEQNYGLGPPQGTLSETKSKGKGLVGTES